MTVENPTPRQSFRPIATGANSAMNQSQFLAITCNSLKAREKWRVHGAIGFGFSSHWLKNWPESFKPITKGKRYQSRNYIRQSFENCSIYYTLSCDWQRLRLLEQFSRASSELQVIARNCDWSIALFTPVAIGRSIPFGFGFSTVIWKPL